MIDISTEPQHVYEYLKSIGAPSIDFLYRDGNYDLLPVGKSSATSLEYGQWLGRLLDYYLADPRPTPIRVLDELIKLILLTRNGFPHVVDEPGIVILDTDGSIKKNDILKSALRRADAFQSDWSVFTHDLVDIAKSSEFLEYCNSQRPTASTCRACTELDVCGGGIPAHRWSRTRGFENPTIFCADQKYLINLVRQRLTEKKLLVA